MDESDKIIHIFICLCLFQPVGRRNLLFHLLYMIKVLERSERTKGKVATNLPNPAHPCKVAKKRYSSLYY